MRKRFLLLAGLLLTLSLLFAGCGGNSAKTEKHLNVALFWLDKNLDPADGWNGWDLSRVAAAESLTTIDENMKLTPLLADKWEAVDDRTWRIHIRQGVKFSNGKDLTPEDVKKSIERAVQKNKRAAESSKFESITVDGEDILFRTTAPYASLMYNLSEPLFSIIDTSASDEEIGKGPVTTAPYVVTGYVPGESIELKANENYWGGKPGLATMTAKLVKDDNTRAMALQSGDTDIAQNIDAASADLFRDKSGYQVLDIPSTRLEFAVMNTAHPFLSNPNVRKALSLAVDREAMAKTYHGDACGTAFPKAAGMGFDELDKQSYNPEEAKRILAQEGFADTDGDGILEKDGKPFAITIQFFKRTTVPEMLQSDLQKIGVKADLVFLEDTLENRKLGKFDLSNTNYLTAMTGDSQRFLTANFATGGSDNYGKYSNPRYDALVARLDTVSDPEERRQISIDAQKILLEDNPYLFLVSPKILIGAKDSVKNLKKYPLDYYLIEKDTTVE